MGALLDVFEQGLGLRAGNLVLKQPNELLDFGASGRGTHESSAKPG
jgi:hypothetical protein